MSQRFRSLRADFARIAGAPPLALRLKNYQHDAQTLQKTPMPIVWAEIGKGYVSYHRMPVQGYPKLVESISPEMRAWTQGKFCVNFKVPDEALFEELDQLTTSGFAVFEKAGFMGWNDRPDIG